MASFSWIRQLMASDWESVGGDIGATERQGRAEKANLFRVLVIHEQHKCPHVENSWMTYWMEKSGQSTHLCLEKHCTSSLISGKLVRLASEPDSEDLYVIPLCEKHSLPGKTIELSREFIPVKCEH